MHLKLFLVSIFFCISASYSFGSFQANFDCKTFMSSGNETYLETHLNFIGGTMTYAPNESGALTAKLEVLLMVKSNGEIIDFEKVEIESPAVIDSLFSDFMDLRRFPVKSGFYKVELELKDLNSKSDEVLIHSEEVIVPTYSEMSISDMIQLSAWVQTTTPNELSRSGYDMLPRVSNFFDGSVDKMGFYTELYNTDKKFVQDSSFALATYIENVSNGEMIASSLSIKKMNTAEILPVFQVKNISDLKEGHYTLVVDIRDAKNQSQFQAKYNFLKAQKFNTGNSEFLEDVSETFANEFSDRDQLYEHLLSMVPRANPAESNTILYTLSHESELKTLQSFFFNFWFTRNRDLPKSEWNNYYEHVLATDLEFGTSIKRGYETDRGRVYLQYGPPNTRVKRPHDTGAHPYEIWHYYKAAQLSNKRFVFLDSEQSVNDYELIQSDMRGEVHNDNWIDLILQDIKGSLINATFDSSQDSRTAEDGARFIIQDLYLNPR